MALMRLIHLLKTVVTVVAINYSCVLCMEESSQGMHEKSLPLPSNKEISTPALKPDIFNNFKIKGLRAELQANGISVSWNILLNEQSGSKRSPARNLTIFQNINSVPESDEITTVMIMKDRCNVIQQVQWTKNATCYYHYHPIKNCTNYKFILGNKNNTAQVTTVPIVQGSLNFELTHHEDNPVKLIWKIDCNATDHMSAVSVSFVRSARNTSFMVDAVCNSTEKKCEAYLGKAQVHPCIPHTINVNQETVILDVERYYDHAVHSLSVKVENANIRIEWNDLICWFNSSNHNARSYALIVFETDTGQVASNISIPSHCIQGTERRILNFDKSNIIYCHGSNETWRLGPVLKSCTNYSVNIVHPKNKNTASLKGSKSPSFVIQSLEPAEIRNLEIADVSSNAFQVKWENPVSCLKVKDLVIPIKINKQWQSLRLSDNNTVCNESTCTVKWEHRVDVSPCTNYIVTVGTAAVLVRTRPPGIATVNIPTNASLDGFSVEWHVPHCCRGWLNIQTERRSSFLDNPRPTENCNNKSCQMLWQFGERLESCTAYSVSLGFFPVNFSTLPDVLDGLATNVTVWSEKQSRGDVDRAVVSWKRPVCQTPILGWQILIRRMPSVTEVVANIPNLVSQFEFDVKPCEIYLITIRTQYKDGGDRYSTAEKSFETKCSLRFLIPIGAIAILLVIAVIIALFFLRMRRRREAVENQTELNNIRTTTTENRNSRLSSISRNRLSSFNRNRISSNSRHSSNGNAENDLVSLPQMSKRPMTVRDLSSFEIGQARKEFFLINKLTEVEAKRLARTTAEQPENKIKNRFLNTHPYDFNRVVLSHSEERQNDSYINASFIPGFGDTENEYIAAQGPKDNTVADFWRMIWEQKVQLIAMVTSLHECGKKKCEKYWPDIDDSMVYGDIHLELLDACVDSFYTARKMRISKSSKSVREIQQFHFTAWPDFETPEEPEQIIRFIEIVRRQARQLNFSSPIVVHCSAGVGRTGTFIALDYLIQQVLITDVVDVPKTVRYLRRFRLSMVQSEAQYVFLYTCIAHYVKTRLATTIGKM